MKKFIFHFVSDHLLMAITLCPPEELNLMADSCTLFTIWISVSGRRGWRPQAPILIILEACLCWGVLTLDFF